MIRGFAGVTGCANCHWVTGKRKPRYEWSVGEVRPLQTTFVAENIAMGEAGPPAQEQNAFAILPAGPAAVPAGRAALPAGQVRFRPRNTIQRDIDRLMAQVTQEVSRHALGLIRRVRAHDMELALPPVYVNLDDEGPEHEAQDADDDDDDEDDEDFDDEGERE